MTPRELYGFMAFRAKRKEAEWRATVRGQQMAAHGDPQKLKRILDEPRD